MTTQTIDYDKEIISRFAAFEKNGRLAHAYLFIGPVSAGKAETALGVAKLLNCLCPFGDMFCDECSSCAKVNNDSHPDVHTFEAITKKESDQGLMRPPPATGVSDPENRTIRIEQVRYLSSRVQLKPFEGRKKVFIIKNSERLTLDAANALLKTLEEPSQNSLLMLTTAFPEKNLRTVTSRCHAVKFRPLTEKELHTRLKDECALGDTAAHFLAQYSQGCAGKAKKYATRNLFKRKNEIIDNFVYKTHNDAYIKKLTGDKDKLRESLDILMSWFRDVLLLKSGVSRQKLIHADRLKDIDNLMAKYSFSELLDIIDEIAGASRSLNDNFNMKVALALLKEKTWRR